MTTHEAQFYGEFDTANENLRERSRNRQHSKLIKLATGTGKRVPAMQQSSVYVGMDTTDSKGRSEQDYFFKNYVHPDAWRPVLENFPELRLCLAHFGGDDWKRGPLSEWAEQPPSEWIRRTVVLTIYYINVYTDLSCFSFDKLLDRDNGEGNKVWDTVSTMLDGYRSGMSINT